MCKGTIEGLHKLSTRKLLRCVRLSNQITTPFPFCSLHQSLIIVLWCAEFEWASICYPWRLPRRQCMYVIWFFFFTKVYFWLLRVWYWFHFDSLTLKVFILVPYVCLGFKRLLSSKSVNGWAAKWLSGTLQYWQDNFILNTHTHTHLLVSGMGAWGVLETAVWVSHWIYRCPWGMKTRSIWLAYILIVIGKLY